MDNQEQDKNKENKGHPFDDVFHTAIVECQRLILPILNEMFHYSYQGDEEVESLDKEAFWHHISGDNQKRTSDSALRVKDKNGLTREFIIECQTNPDNDMVLRILEYGFKFAIDRADKSINQICINIPSTGVLQLRAKEEMSDNMQIRIIAPDNKELSYNVPLLKMEDYTIPKSVKLQLQNASQVLHHLQLQDFYCFTQWVKQELSLSESK